MPFTNVPFYTPKPAKSSNATMNIPMTLGLIPQYMVWHSLTGSANGVTETAPVVPTDRNLSPTVTISEQTEQPQSPNELQPPRASATLLQSPSSPKSTQTPGTPQIRSRPRAASTLSVASTTASRPPSFISEDEDDQGDSSSDDSMLSWWSDDSSDDEEAEGEETSEKVENGQGNDTTPKAKKTRRSAPKPPTNPEKEAERKRREAQRHSLLAAAGLQVTREPSVRRAAPAVPGGRKRRHAPAVPEGRRRGKDLPPIPDEQYEKSERLGTQDAYARYEAFLAQSAQAQSQPLPRPESLSVQSRPSSQGLSPQTTGQSPQGAPLSPTSTITSLPPSIGKEAGGKISGFFKSVLATHHPEPKRPSISGPTISRVGIDDQPSSPSPGSTGQSSEAESSEFGKTWSSLVEPSVLNTMDKSERKRQEAIFEFIATENAYNRDLQLIVEASDMLVFYASLLSMLDEKALTVIFANIEDILLFNTGFFSALEERQKAARLYVVKIGDVLSFLNEAGIYMTYCINQHQAIKLLQSLREERPELNAHLQHIRETNASIRGLDLSSFLLIPMQRITRYPLLIKQIIAYTPYDHSDLPQLEQALRVTEGIVSRINESVRESEGQERLRTLSENLWIGGEGRLDLTAPTAFSGPRRLVKEGTVTKAKSGRKLTMLLCNDIIVLLDNKDLYRMPLALHEVEVKQTRDVTGFALRADQRRGGDTVALKVMSASDAKDWMGKIDRARKQALSARRAM
ncbi:hypothetical protein L198_04672 [Cryptococcus wingfieldii CBS 7118]|uniref:DH domain-containing protein n=1 Tax=Cryptococcus wingfieldii CBS 7118 TaxID=1295528 RepID=A0A1E3J5Q7_9TREE|nr:hypothetical protein L198_04672 [Cryptococcus wingfieldii CBS 7118]ODN95281.1 hypothetical protein L198_04672 [Cryptococcus wingfieldii CBS 7118]